ncbi:MAG: SIS domain-containing protein [Magnetococcales bacterium]|nr:SIS domain-containing protein [Magnetococcales bacterium]
MSEQASPGREVNAQAAFADHYRQYVDFLNRVLTAIDADSVERVVNLFLEARAKGRTIFFAGNGGSAATASHFAQDLSEVGRKAGVAGFRSLGLADNVSYITAAGNDHGYESIFTNQMTNLFQEGDLLVVISASGNSANVIKALRMAKSRGGTTVALVGFDGGVLAREADAVIIARTARGEYGPVEDVHMIMDHVITDCLYQRLARA